MGIRFNCHLCNHPLHVKDFQANKRGKCPSCQGAFRVPSKSAEYSISLDPKLASSSGVLMPVPKSMSKRVAQGATDTASAKSSSAKSPVHTETEPNGTNQSQGSTQAPEAATTVKSIDAAAIPQTSDIPASLLPHIDARWFVRPPSGGQYGPATTPMLVDWITERRITADSFLWREGMESWMSAVEVIPERFGPIPIAPVTAASGTISPTSAPASDVANELLREASPGSMASSKAAVSTKKKRQQRQQWIVLGLLVTIALSLAAALIYILWRS